MISQYIYVVVKLYSNLKYSNNFFYFVYNSQMTIEELTVNITKQIIKIRETG